MYPICFWIALEFSKTPRGPAGWFLSSSIPFSYILVNFLAFFGNKDGPATDFWKVRRAFHWFMNSSKEYKFSSQKRIRLALHFNTQGQFKPKLGTYSMILKNLKTNKTYGNSTRSGLAFNNTSFICYSLLCHCHLKDILEYFI